MVRHAAGAGSVTTDVFRRLTATLADRYRVERELGAGGMATVYLAHDLKHERDVAIKVLHPDLGAALGADRFLSEIKTTAKLQHPHILPLLDSGAADGLLYYVMPFMRGETLRARLERERQLPIDDALRIAREVALALDHAHKQGIIHRDIKPENILLQDGAAVVADFGIALAVQQAGGARMTQTGLSLGTPQYMSPEQAMGEKNIDARSDIYALGAVTYEMLAGEPPFSGSSTQAIVAKVLTERPTPLRTLRDMVPTAVEQAVLSALMKLPADRPASAAEFATSIERGRGADVAIADVRTRRTAPSWMGWALGATLFALVATGFLLWKGSGAGSRDETVVRMVLEHDRDAYVPVLISRTLAISPDGSAIAARLRVSAGNVNTLRRIGELNTEIFAIDALDLSFSPDGSWLAYWKLGELYKREVRGGDPVRITLKPMPDGAKAGNQMDQGGTVWIDNGQLVWSCRDGLCVTDLATGTSRVVLNSRDDARWRAPVYLRGRNGVLVTRFSAAKTDGEIMWVDLASGRAHAVGIDGGVTLGLVDDAIIYVSTAGDVMAAPFDVAALHVRGEGVRVETGVMTVASRTGGAYAALSENGHLVYHSAAAASELVRVSTDGQVRPLLNDTLWYEFPRYSPDGKRIVMNIVDPQTRRRGVFVLDQGTGILSTVAAQQVNVDRDRPEWSADGQRVLYRVNSDARTVFAMRSISGVEAEEIVLAGPGKFNEAVMLANGRTFLGRVNDGAPASDKANSQQVWRWQLGDTTKVALTDDSFNALGPRPSPDGKWFAYVVGVDVYVAPMLGTGVRVRVNRAPAGLPVWRRDGRALLFANGSGIAEVTLRFTPNPEVVSTRQVVEGIINAREQLHAPFDIGPDNDIIGVRPVREARTIVVRNFGVEVKRALAGSGKR
jgi:eukaryotic-like serine/threonine-protein kinase